MSETTAMAPRFGELRLGAAVTLSLDGFAVSGKLVGYLRGGDGLRHLVLAFEDGSCAQLTLPTFRSTLS